jgi:hypothetical protein
MPSTDRCNVCDDLFLGKREIISSTRGLYIHHENAKALIRAARRGCSFCDLLWTSIGRDTEFHETESVQYELSQQRKEGYLFIFTMVSEKGVTLNGEIQLVSWGMWPNILLLFLDTKV